MPARVSARLEPPPEHSAGRAAEHRNCADIEDRFCSWPSRGRSRLSTNFGACFSQLWPSFVPRISTELGAIRPNLARLRPTLGDDDRIGPHGQIWPGFGQHRPLSIILERSRQMWTRVRPNLARFEQFGPRFGRCWVNSTEIGANSAQSPAWPDVSQHNVSSQRCHRSLKLFGEFCWRRLLPSMHTAA